MSLTRRQLRTLTIVGFVVALVATPVLGALLAGTPTQGSIILKANSGNSIEIVGAQNMSFIDEFPDDNTVSVATNDGNATFVSTGETRAQVDASDLTGTWTTVTNLTVDSTELMINPADKRAVNVSGNIDSIQFRDVVLDDGSADFVYSGSSGTSTVTVRGVTANSQIRAVDLATGDVMAVGVSDSNGKVTLANMANSQHSIGLRTGSASPILTNPTPDGNVSSSPSTFAVNVTDSDFPGDEVQIDFYYEGSLIDSVNTTSTGEVSTNAVPAVSSGVHEWSVVATDSAGNEDIVNATVGVPGTLFIRNVSNTSELVTSPVNVTASFENGTTIIQKTTTTGTIDMTGLATTDFIVTIDASEKYYGRTVYKQSIIGDDSVYLLNQNVTSVESRFVLSDPTGRFPSNSLLIVKKPINVSGTIQYRTVHSDYFGVEGVTADLEEGERYLISVRSPDGTVQQVGPYRADLSETVTVRPGSPTISFESYEEGWATNSTLNNVTLEFGYDDPDNLSQQVTVWVHEKNNKSNRLRPNVSYYDLGSFEGAYTLTANESEKTWVVNYIIDRDNEQYVATDVVSNNPNLVPNLSDEWRLITGIGILLISAGVFSMLNAGVGGVVVAIEGGVLWWTGWLTGATTGAAVVIALFVAILFHLYSSSA